MEFKLLYFKIHGVDGMTYAKFVIEKDGKQIEFDEMTRFENKEDVTLLQAIETFINAKVVKK